jgi:hypothetical protein
VSLEKKNPNPTGASKAEEAQRFRDQGKQETEEQLEGWSGLKHDEFFKRVTDDANRNPKK